MDRHPHQRLERKRFLHAGEQAGFAEEVTGESRFSSCFSSRIATIPMRIIISDGSN
jgi:hypothetical protein